MENLLYVALALYVAYINHENLLRDYKISYYRQKLVNQATMKLLVDDKPGFEKLKKEIESMDKVKTVWGFLKYANRRP